MSTARFTQRGGVFVRRIDIAEAPAGWIDVLYFRLGERCDGDGIKKGEHTPPPAAKVA